MLLLLQDAVGIVALVSTADVLDDASQSQLESYGRWEGKEYTEHKRISYNSWPNGISRPGSILYVGAKSTDTEWLVAMVLASLSAQMKLTRKAEI